MLCQNSEKIPGYVFLRGSSVGILCILNDKILLVKYKHKLVNIEYQFYKICMKYLLEPLILTNHFNLWQ